MFLYLKAFRSVLIALLIIILIEGFVFLKTGSKGDDFRLLSLEYMKETSEKSQFILIDKLNHFQDKENVEMLTVGDSSGLVALDQKIIEKYLGGMKMYNANIVRLVGIDGYRYVAEIFLKKANNIKYLIYHIAPYQYKIGDPKRVGWSEDIYKNYLSYYHYIFALPTTKERINILNFVYYFGEDRLRIFSTLASLNNGISLFADWQNPKRDVGECNFSEGWVDNGDLLLNDELEKVKKLADKYKVKLIVIFGATSCIPGEKIIPLIKDLEKFQKNNSDVIIPIGLVNHSDVSQFQDRIHLDPSASAIYSEMIGRILQEKVLNK